MTDVREFGDNVEKVLLPAIILQLDPSGGFSDGHDLRGLHRPPIYLYRYIYRYMIWDV